MTTRELTTGTVTPATAWWLAQIVERPRPTLGASLRISEGFEGECVRLYLVHDAQGFNVLKLRKMGRKRAWHYSPGLERLRGTLRKGLAV